MKNACTTRAAVNSSIVRTSGTSSAPAETSSTSEPSRYGPAMEAITATALTVTSSRNALRCRRARSAMYARTVAVPATGSFVASVGAAGS